MEIQRVSPIRFDIKAVETETRDGWQVALSYGQHQGPFLIDLSHRRKWDLQSSNLARYRPFGISIPDKPGQSVFSNGIIINRMSRTQCYVWNLAAEKVRTPQSPSYTEITDGHALLAVTGPSALAVMERVTNLDLASPSLSPPCLIQGPILHVACQIVLLSRSKSEATVLFSFPRGYGQSVADALLHSGRDIGLVPGGESQLKL